MAECLRQIEDNGGHSPLHSPSQSLRAFTVEAGLHLECSAHVRE